MLDPWTSWSNLTIAFLAGGAGVAIIVVAFSIVGLLDFLFHWTQKKLGSFLITLILFTFFPVFAFFYLAAPFVREYL